MQSSRREMHPYRTLSTELQRSGNLTIMNGSSGRRWCCERRNQLDQEASRGAGCCTPKFAMKHSIHIGFLGPIQQIIFCFVAAAVVITGYTWNGIRFDNSNLRWGWMMNYLTLWNELMQALYWSYSLVVACFIYKDMKVTEGDTFDQHVSPSRSSANKALGVNEHDFIDEDAIRGSEHVSEMQDYQTRAAFASFGRETSHDAQSEGSVAKTLIPGSSRENKCKAACARIWCSTCALWPHGNCLTDSSFRQFKRRRIGPTTASLMVHRDRWFTLVSTMGSFVAIIYWVALFPHKDPPNFMTHGRIISDSLTLLHHGFTALVAWIDIFCIRHRYPEQPLWTLLLSLGFGAAYLGWNILCHHFNQHWTYSTLQGGLSIGQAIGLYAGLFLVLFILHIAVYFIVCSYWRKISSLTAVEFQRQKFLKLSNERNS
eukprot:gb/GECG01004787.1/.p1 GENE.gb/GECG01004787.1/~~gb/GECG01004787.1/.p1  ORF type:complete len:429 (+),score=22.37 gb/GECG01004787.1/:1-1287(+)